MARKIMLEWFDHENNRINANFFDTEEEIKQFEKGMNEFQKSHTIQAVSVFYVVEKIEFNSGPARITAIGMFGEMQNAAECLGNMKREKNIEFRIKERVF
jgi:hypothetical protein